MTSFPAISLDWGGRFRDCGGGYLCELVTRSLYVFNYVFCFDLVNVTVV